MKKSHLNRQFTETFKAALLFVNNLLVEADGVFLQGKHVVSKDDDLVVTPLMKANEKLASTELVGVHRVQQDALLRLDGHVLSVKLRRHRAPHLKKQTQGVHCSDGFIDVDHAPLVIQSPVIMAVIRTIYAGVKVVVQGLTVQM